MQIPPISEIKSMEDALRLAGKMNNFTPDEQIRVIKRVNWADQIKRFEQECKLNIKA